MLIKNGFVLDGTTNSFQKRDLYVKNGFFSTESDDDSVLDAEGLYVISGFIDTHIHGCVGVEFASDNEDFTRARRWLASEGVTSVAPTIRAMTPDRIFKAIDNIRREQMRQTDCAARILGINLEGPFISYEKSGVMNPPDVECTPKTVCELAQKADGLLKIITIAPERENASEAIKAAVSQGVNVSLGHSNALYDRTLSAIEAGATRATHVFNAMRPFSHRETGILGAVLTDDRINCEMICDLVHLDEATIRLVYRAKGYKNLTLVSDTGYMSGLGDGEYIVDGRKRIVKDGVCKNESGRIAGSCASMLKGAKNLLRMGIPLAEISVMASLNPAKALGVDSLVGSVEVGKKADFIVCDSSLDVKTVYIDGKKV